MIVVNEQWHNPSNLIEGFLFIIKIDAIYCHRVHHIVFSVVKSVRLGIYESPRVERTFVASYAQTILRLRRYQNLVINIY